MQNTQNTVNYATAKQMIRLSIEDRVPLLILGNPGIGKTSIVRQIAKEVGIQCAEHLGYLYEPVDMRGLMVPDPKSMTTKAYSLGRWPLNRLIELKQFEERGVLLLDEMLNAHRDVLTAFAEPLCDHAVNGEPLGAGWNIIATGNHLGSGTSANALPSHVTNRVSIICVEPSWDEWVKWATGIIRPELIDYFDRTSGVDLFTYDPKKISPNQPYLTPRSLENLSRKLDAWWRINPSSKPPLSVYSSVVGEYGGKLYATLDYLHELVSWDEIEADPDKCRLPQHPAAVYAQIRVITGAFSKMQRVNERSAACAIKFIGRINRKEIEAAAITSWIKLTEFCKTPQASKWMADNIQII